MKTKTCVKCKETKKLSKFHKSKRHYFGVKNECSKCTNAYLREHYKNNYRGKEETKRKKTEYHYKRKYGISYEDYLIMCKDRKNKCDICQTKKVPAGSEIRGSKDHLVLDHCHETKKIRGILCQECNQGLGLFKDSSFNLEKAVIYLKNTDTDKKEG